MRCVFGKPFLGGEEGMRLIMGKEVADNLGALGHEEPLAPTELLLFQLSDEFDLVLTDCHGYRDLI